LLPSLSGILKVRKYKLSQYPAQTNESAALTVGNATNRYAPYFQEVSKNITSGVSLIESETPVDSNILGAPISRFFLVRSFSSTILTSLQIPAFLLAPKAHN
jgi:hypothetical protein